MENIRKIPSAARNDNAFKQSTEEGIRRFLADPFAPLRVSAPNERSDMRNLFDELPYSPDIIYLSFRKNPLTGGEMRNLNL